MSQSNDDAKSSTVIEMELNSVELKEVDNPADILENTKKKTIDLDAIDHGCVGCSSKDSDEKKENISLSSSSDDDDDDDTEQAISMDTKKLNTLSYKGMMDIALLTANANQLRFLITYNSGEKTFLISVTLIILSMFVQVAVGIGLIYKRHMKKKGNKSKAEKVVSFVIIGMFCLAVLNALVVSFTTAAVTNPN